MNWLIKSRLLLDPGVPKEGGGNPPAPPAPPAPDPAAIEKARLEERAKLGQMLADLTAKLDAAANKIKELESALATTNAEFNTLKTTHEALKSGIKPGETGVDVEAAISSAVNSALTQYSAQVKGDLSRLQTELETERRARQIAELEKVRIQVIEEHGGANALVPELVVGNTVEELRAAAQKSQATFKSILEKAGYQPGTIPNPPSPAPTVPRTVTPPPPGTPPGGVLPGGRIPLKEYAEKRAQLKADALRRAQAA